ncbi:MAG: hypothetical protein KBT88_09910 [Gammaproteobacteria bacterium]|nr:hypothetical protein [Gammaproteobacteria bacterium]MBQ0840090.1 hypothetical protein [Gammaproteobacteria bacterium]
MRVWALLIIIYLPEIVVPVVFHLYKDTFYEDVVAGLAEVVNDEPYCIIVPRVKQQRIPGFFIFPERIHSYREWVVVMDPAAIDYRHILDHAIRQGWLFYAKEGRGYGKRGEIGTEMHFGVAKKGAFYLWSFKKRRFVEHVVPIPSALYWMKKGYTDLRHYQRYSNRPEYGNSDDYYCPFYMKSGD